jgi:hypothetical protein
MDRIAIIPRCTAKLRQRRGLASHEGLNHPPAHNARTAATQRWSPPS